MLKNLMIVFAITFLLVACGEQPTPKYKIGDIVVSIIDNKTAGQIRGIVCAAGQPICDYHVRFTVNMKHIYISEDQIQLKE